MSSATRHAIIAGAGIGGLCAALALARAGLRVSVFERAPLLEEAGAGIQLPPNAMRALDTLGLGETLRARADATQGLHVRALGNGQSLMRLPQAAMQARWGVPSLVMHRADLARLLLEAIALTPGISVAAGMAVAGFAAGVDGVSVALRRGLMRQQVAGDLLIGADGLRSAVRAAPQDSASDHLRFSGSFAWRALVEAERLPASLRTPETALWLGPKLHLVHYPLRHGALVNVVAVLAGGAPAVPAKDEWNVPGEAAVIDAAFRQAAPQARALIAAADSWRIWPLYDRLPPPGWTQGRTALLGDAAHPMLPYLAQGAAQAIEDAVALAAALKGNGDTAAALVTYARARLVRTSEVVRQSRRQGAIYHLAGPAALVRNLVMRYSSQDRLLGRLDWLYAPHS